MIDRQQVGRSRFKVTQAWEGLVFAFSLGYAQLRSPLSVMLEGKLPLSERLRARARR